jgi:RNA polymerase sigma factor (sigma-70 family)
LNEADKHLLTLIHAGNADGWSQFVARFQARLIAFAMRKVDQLATAEDLVQETFLGFLQSIESYREQCDLESFLFQIIRRRIVDHYRRLGKNIDLPACEFRSGETNDGPGNPIEIVSGSELSPSHYVRQDEQTEQDKISLTAAIEQLASELQAKENFRDLQIAEGLFYGHRRSLELAQAMSISENEVAVVKRRLLARLAKAVSAQSDMEPSATRDPLVASGLLSSIWETQRPSCPKRTTLGKYTLGILSPAWSNFVRFHVEVLGCTFCNANLAELQRPPDSPESLTRQSRLFNSTVGFLQCNR